MLCAAAAAAIVHLIVGSSAGRPSLDDVRYALADLDVVTSDLGVADRQAPASSPSPPPVRTAASSSSRCTAATRTTRRCCRPCGARSGCVEPVRRSVSAVSDRSNTRRSSRCWRARRGSRPTGGHRRIDAGRRRAARAAPHGHGSSSRTGSSLRRPPPTSASPATMRWSGSASCGTSSTRLHESGDRPRPDRRGSSDLVDARRRGSASSTSAEPPSRRPRRRSAPTRCRRSSRRSCSPAATSPSPGSSRTGRTSASRRVCPTCSRRRSPPISVG